MTELRIKSNFGEGGAGIGSGQEVGLKDILKSVVENQNKLNQAIADLNTAGTLGITLPELDTIIFEE